MNDKKDIVDCAFLSSKIGECILSQDEMFDFGEFLDIIASNASKCMAYENIYTILMRKYLNNQYDGDISSVLNDVLKLFNRIASNKLALFLIERLVPQICTDKVWLLEYILYNTQGNKIGLNMPPYYIFSNIVNGDIR